MSPDRLRIVLDTGVVISALLRPDSIPAAAMQRAVHSATMLVSEATIAEFLEVLTHDKFMRYIAAADAHAAIEAYYSVAEIVPVHLNITASRDADDDKFLALALSGNADAIVSGDGDLLDLHPFQGVSILSPRQFIDLADERANPHE
jgi:putative PIN family toxin of toxin-antitoxin system